MGSSLPATPISFRALGLYDALEGESAPAGACFYLQNLVHDVTTPFVWNARPGAVRRTTFPAFTSPTVVSVAIAIGQLIFGMIASNSFAGFDAPFCYDNASGTFTSISGATVSNLPATQAFTGAWTPPSMAVVGNKIIVAHAGFSGSGSNFFGVIDITTIAAPTWTAANTSSNSLPNVPNAVFQFNNRAWFACKNLAYYSDSLAPTTLTSSSQFLTLGSGGSNITCFGGLPLQQTVGGILAALIGFKAEGFWQIAGDTATSNLTLNGPFTPGCTAPRTVYQVPIGLAFMADSGVRIIGFDGTVQAAPLPGVRSPFGKCVVPSRAAAAYSNTVYRISLQTIPNPLNAITAFVEYWYDFENLQWTGPHSICCDVIVPIPGTFIIASNRQQGALYQSDVDMVSTSLVTEFNQTLTFRYQTTMQPDDGGMAMKSIVESQIDIDFGSQSNTVTAQWLSAAEGVAGTANISAIVGTYWNQFNWNQANWSPSQYGLRTYNIDWDGPVVYKTGAFALYGALSKGLRLGPARFRVEELGYMNSQVPA